MKINKRVLSLVMTGILSISALQGNIKVKADDAKETKKEKTIVKEIIEKRTENQKVFLNSDGTYTARIYSAPVHFKNGDKFEEIDNTLDKQQKKDKSGNVYKNKSNSISVSLDEDITSETPISLEEDNYRVYFKPNIKNNLTSANVKEIKKKDIVEEENKRQGIETKSSNSQVLSEQDNTIQAIQYENIGEDINARYTPTNSGFKEEIIINSYKDQNKFEFTLILKDLAPVFMEGGAIALKDKNTNLTKGIIEKPYMYDSSKEQRFSEKVSMEIKKIDGRDSNAYTLVVTADEGFLKDKNTTYPVVVDPSTWLGTVNDTQDAYVQSLYPDSNYYDSTQLRAGYDSTTGRVRSYIQFPSLPSISGGVVLSAVYSAYNTTNVAYGNFAYINLHRVLSSWSSGSITWNNAPSYDSDITAQAAVSSPGWVQWDVSSLVSGWYWGDVPNYGFMLKDSGETYCYRRFDSSDGTNIPRLDINYALPVSGVTSQAFSSGANTSTGYVNVSWNAVPDVSGYKVAVWDGRQYELFDVGNTTSWTTNGKNIWPTYTEINSLERYALHYDKAGQELPNDPSQTYINANAGYGGYHNYWFRVIAYNKFGHTTSLDNNYTTPTLPDSTKPGTTNTPTITFSNPQSQQNNWQISTTWQAPTDYPIGMASGLSSYKVILYKNPGDVYQKEVTVPADTTNAAFTGLTDSTRYYVAVQAFDNSGNYSEISKSSEITTGDKTPPSAPSSVTIDKTGWTNASSVVVSWQGINDISGLKTVQYSLDGTNWTATGSNQASGSCTINTGSLAETTTKIYIRGIDTQNNTGASGYVNYSKDTTSPISLLDYPLMQQTINGVISVKGTATDLHLKDWRVEYGLGTSPTSYTTVATGTTAVTNAIMTSWNVSALAEGTYTLRLIVNDTAGNNKISSVQVLKSNQVSYSPTLQIDSPLSGAIINTLSQNVKYQRINNGGAANLKGKLYINNALVSEETTVGAGLSFNPSNYPEGVENNMYIEAIDVDGNKLYSTTMYTAQDGSNTVLAQSNYVFKVKLVNEPKNLTATPNVNYNTLLRWSYDGSIFLDQVTFNVYRDKTPNFKPSSSNKIAEGLGTTSWNDYNLNYGQTFYYKVTTVKKVNNIPRESVPSNEAYASVVAKNELDKRLGLEDYWGYSQFRTGSGEGYINVSSGNLSYQSVDFVFPGTRFTESMRRTYNSQATSKTAQGYGFDFSFNTNILKEYDTAGSQIGIILKDGDGSIHRFTKNADGTFTSEKGLYMILTYNNTDGTYKLKRKDNIEYQFDKFMKLSKFVDPNGNYLQMVYNMRGNLETITDNQGNTTKLSYDDKDRLFTVTDPANRVFTYEYYPDNPDRLKKMYIIIENNVEYSEEYEYDSSYSNIIKIKDPKKNVTNLEYQSEKLFRVTDPEPKAFTFNYETGKTTITPDKGKPVSFEYNQYGNVTRKTDALGHSVNYEYDSNYNVTRMYYLNIIDGVEKEINYNYTYDDMGNVKTIKAPSNNTSTTENITEYNDYNSFNEVREIKRSIGNGQYAINAFTYDNKGNMLTATDPENRTTAYTYYASGNIYTSTDNFGKVTTYGYDTKGRLNKISEPLGKVTEILEYDAQNNPVIIKDSRLNEIKMEYDLLGRKYKTTYPSLVPGEIISEETVYDLNGNVTNSKDKKGHWTSYDYDSVDRVKTLTPPNSIPEYVTYTYDINNNLVVTNIDGESRITKKYYNDAGQLTKDEANGTYVIYYYDYIGNMIKSMDAENRETTVVYNELNQLVKTVKDPSNLGIKDEFTYDLLGNKLTSKVGNDENYKVSYQYDKIGRLRQVTSKATCETGLQTVNTNYYYDIKDGEYIYNKVLDNLQRETRTYFDILGRKVKEVKRGDTTDAKEQTTSYAYNVKGDLETITKPDTKTIGYVYDILGRLKTVTYDINNYTSYEYDNNDNRTKMTDVKDGISTITSYSYNNMNRVLQYVQDGSGISYDYDNSGNVTHIRYQPAATSQDLEYKYDSFNRLESIKLNGQVVRNYAYTSSGKIDYIDNHRKFDTGASVYTRIKYNYDTAGLPEEISYYADGYTLNEKYTVSYNDRGLIKDETSYVDYSSTNNTSTNTSAGTIYPLKPTYPTPGYNQIDMYSTNDDTQVYSSDLGTVSQPKTINKSYDYDEAGRLKAVTNITANKTTNYTYDSVGNRASMSDGTDSYRYFYNQFNAIDEIQKNGQTISSFEYDVDGNQTKDISKKDVNGILQDVTTTYGYDRTDRLINLSIFDGTTTKNISNTYNGDGKRIRQEEDNNTTKYYYTGDSLLFETDKNNIVGQDNILDPGGRIVASKRFDGNYSNMYFFYNYDMRGSVTSILKPDGSVVKGYDYDEFGNTKENGEAQFKNDIKFTGAVHDTSTGLYYMNARFYNPSTGKFLSQDTYSGNPYDPWTQNLYSYTSNDPVNFVDPTGHMKFSVTDDVAGTSVVDTSVASDVKSIASEAFNKWVEFGDSIADWQDKHKNIMTSLSLAMIFTPMKAMQLEEDVVNLEESQFTLESNINKAISKGAAKAESTGLKEFDIAPYGDFKNYPNDNLTAHELLQNAWLEGNGKILKRGQGISKDNPAIALYENPMHKFISGQQKSLGLNKSNLAGTSWRSNVLDNIQIMKDAGVPRDKIAELARQTRKFAIDNGF